MWPPIVSRSHPPPWLASHCPPLSHRVSHSHSPSRRRLRISTLNLSPSTSQLAAQSTRAQRPVHVDLPRPRIRNTHNSSGPWIPRAKPETLLKAESAPDGAARPYARAGQTGCIASSECSSELECECKSPATRSQDSNGREQGVGCGCLIVPAGPMAKRDADYVAVAVADVGPSR